MPLYQTLTTMLTDYLAENMLLVFEQVEDSITNAGGGLGECGGGYFRSVAADMAFFRILPDDKRETAAQAIGLFVKTFLCILPALCSAQWLYRAYTGAKGAKENPNARVGKRTKRIAVRTFLGCTGLLQCALLLNADVNAANGGLMNFWLCVLLGAVFESLLGTDDIRGVFRQLLVALIFIFI